LLSRLTLCCYQMSIGVDISRTTMSLELRSRLAFRMTSSASSTDHRTANTGWICPGTGLPSRLHFTIATCFEIALLLGHFNIFGLIDCVCAWYHRHCGRAPGRHSRYNQLNDLPRRTFRSRRVSHTRCAPDWRKRCNGVPWKTGEVDVLCRTPLSPVHAHSNVHASRVQQGR